jgi:hypothetical protein
MALAYPPMKQPKNGGGSIAASGKTTMGNI